MRRSDLYPTSQASSAFARAVHEAIPQDGVTLWSLGGSGLLVKSADTLLTIDPYLSNRLGDLQPDAPVGWRDRNAPAPIRPQDLTRLSAILITHEHGDHFDPETLKALIEVNPSARVVAPRSLSGELGKLGVDERAVLHPQSCRKISMENWEFEAIPAAHVPPESPTLQPDGQGGHYQIGYLLELAGVCIYHAGDTIVYDGLPERLADRVDLAVLPINGRRWSLRQPSRRGNLDYEEAADLAALINSRALIPVHHELLGSSARPIQPFLAYVEQHYPRLEILALTAGDRADVSRTGRPTSVDRSREGGCM